MIQIESSGKVNFSKNVVIEKNLTVNGGAIFSGTLDVKREANFEKSSTFANQVNLQADEIVSKQNITIDGKDILKSLFPIGCILPFGGDKLPQGYLICNGADFSSEDRDDNEYRPLFEVIQYNWGKMTNGNFRVPDLRGYFLRGVDGGKKRDPDVDGRTSKYPDGATKDNVGSVQADSNKSHSHKTEPHSHPINFTTKTGPGFYGQQNKFGFKATTGWASEKNLYLGTGGKPSDGWKIWGASWESHVSKNQGDDTTFTGGKEARPKNAYVNYLIKY